MNNDLFEIEESPRSKVDTKNTILAISAIGAGFSAVYVWAFKGGSEYCANWFMKELGKYFESGWW
jgi:hypothetical protein